MPPKRKQKPKPPSRKSPTPLISEIGVLNKMSASEQALDILHEIATSVAPILRLYNFKVGKLHEFFPKNPNLLGLNTNAGQKISIRLRPNNNPNWFLPMNELIGTMLHELSHNWFGPHDQKFYKLMDELQNKFYDIQVNGDLKATGYIIINSALGGSNNVSNVRESRLRKLSQVKYVAKVAKVGTNLDPKKNQGKLPEDLMKEAAIRRVKDNSSCGSHVYLTDAENAFAEGEGDEQDLYVVKWNDNVDGGNANQAFQSEHKRAKPNTPTTAIKAPSFDPLHIPNYSSKAGLSSSSSLSSVGNRPPANSSKEQPSNPSARIVSRTDFLERNHFNSSSSKTFGGAIRKGTNSNTTRITFGAGTTSSSGKLLGGTGDTSTTNTQRRGKLAGTVVPRSLLTNSRLVQNATAVKLTTSTMKDTAANGVKTADSLPSSSANTKSSTNRNEREVIDLITDDEDEDKLVKGITKQINKGIDIIELN